MKQLKALFILHLLFLCSTGYGQDIRCYTTELDSARGLQEFRKENFEDWMEQKLVQKKLMRSGRVEAVVQIPVVFHVIHNGESLGQGINISYEQIATQLQVINEDFRRTNPDRNQTPAEFEGVAADAEIEFIFAKQDPQGLPTDGVIRVNGGRSSWKWQEQSIFKSKSYWPAEDYLNIWITDLVIDDETNLLGFAQYPVASGLSGIDFAVDNRETDGVAIDYTVTGSQLLFPGGIFNPNFNRGRTLTHELGHFFSLRHIWGDRGICGATDYVADTPDQLSDTAGCPSSKESCTSTDMFQNYMDYTSDACMNLFTVDQAARMRVVLENSPRRASLTTSHALQDPTVLDDDAGITKIITPGQISCPGNNVPVIEIKNFGNNQLNSIEIEVLLNGISQEVKTFNPNLSYLESTNISFSPLLFTPGFTYNLEFSIQSVNNLPDNKEILNNASISTQTSSNISLPYSQDFDTFPNDWIVLNNDNNLTWDVRQANNGNPSNSAAYINYYDYDGIGQSDWLISPLFDLTGSNVAFLQFEVSHATYPSSLGEALTVAVISSCNSTIEAIDTIYFKNTQLLATSEETVSEFVPQGSIDWRTEEFIDLSEYIGDGNIQLAFIARNGYGNNLYIDNVFLTNSVSLDAAIEGFSEPAYYTCDRVGNYQLQIRNNGTEIINSLDILWNLNGVNQTRSLTGLNLLPGKTVTEVLQGFNFITEGEYSISVNLSNPNGTEDNFPGNNSLVYDFSIDSKYIPVPFLETFDNIYPPTPWKAFTNNNEFTWSDSNLDDNTFMSVEAYNNGRINDEAWLISELIDLSETEKASIFFDLAYSPGLSSTEELFFMVSEDCGTTWQTVDYPNNQSSIITVQEFIPDFIPTSEEDWRKEFINLNEYAGNSELRFAFRVKNGRGNNLHLDNIELFLDDDETPLQPPNNAYTGVYPNITDDGTFKITFDLENASSIKVTVYTLQGEILQIFRADRALNQTFEFKLNDAASGLYIVRVDGEGFAFLDKLIIER